MSCYARIVGGWDRGKDDRGHFSVKLDIVLPTVSGRAAISAPERIRPPKKSRKADRQRNNDKFRHRAASLGLRLSRIRRMARVNMVDNCASITV